MARISRISKWERQKIERSRKQIGRTGGVALVKTKITQFVRKLFPNQIDYKEIKPDIDKLPPRKVLEVGRLIADGYKVKALKQILSTPIVCNKKRTG